jgi:predicted phage baseplate assembly protein
MLVPSTTGPAAIDPTLPASSLLVSDAGAALPAIHLTDAATERWEPVHDLLESGKLTRDFVVEVEANGVAALRFGDGINGRVPESGTAFQVSYRIGNGTAGNVGADSLLHLAAADARVTACRNPLPGRGGVDPETNDQIRRRAPQAFLTQERAVTMADYEAIAERNPQIDRAVANLRWTGSWYTVFIAAEPQGGGRLAPTLRSTVEGNVNRYRLAGQDLELDSPQYLSLEIALDICVDPNYFRLDVEKILQQVLGSQALPDGTRGLFFPDSFTFGQTVYLSPIYAAARSVPGVKAVQATVFQPQGVNTSQYLDAGEIPLGALQVARLDNDPNFPDHGRLTLTLEGGK